MSSLLMATGTVRTGRSTMLPHLPVPRIRDLACTEPVGEACRASPRDTRPVHCLCMRPSVLSRSGLLCPALCTAVCASAGRHA